MTTSPIASVSGSVSGSFWMVSTSSASVSSVASREIPNSVSSWLMTMTIADPATYPVSRGHER